MEIEPRLIYVVIVGIFGLVAVYVKIAVDVAQIKTHGKDQNGRTQALEKDNLNQWEKIGDNTAAVARIEGAHSA